MYLVRKTDAICANFSFIFLSSWHFVIGYVVMLSSVKISLALVSLLILVHVNEAFPMKEWLPRRSMVKDEDSAIEQRFDEDSYSR